MTSHDAYPAPTAGKRPSVGHDEAATRAVRDVMIRTPKTLPATATAADARALFANPKVLAIPLVDGATFAGLLEAGDLPETVTEQTPALAYASTAVPTITPDQSMAEALDLMVGGDVLRLVVLAEDGATLRGLLALDHDRTGFCQGS